ncbi:hypothetical protein MPER_02296, partial [Moniliophthora perniciosa FA553]
SEGGEIHKQDLAVVRSKFDETADQLKSNHNSTWKDLRTEHAELLETQAKNFEKQINKLTLDLKATQDDLAKAKAAADSSRIEIESLTAQRDAARAAAEAGEAAPSLAASEEIARLTKELAMKKDDLDAITEMLNLTKASLTDVSNNHQIELEENAKARAE